MQQRLLQDFMDTVRRNRLGVDAVQVNQGGKVLDVHHFDRGGAHDCFSVAKSFLSTGIGIAIGEGKLTLQDSVTKALAEHLPDDIDPRYHQLTLRNLLTMTTGHDRPWLMSGERARFREEAQTANASRESKDWAYYAFTRPIVHEPGTVFSYGNLAPYLACCMLEKAVGATLRDYLYEKFWKPMGIACPRWDSCPAGHTFSASDLFMDIGDMIQLGTVYLNGGRFEDQQLVPAQWVEQATSKQVESAKISPEGSGEDETYGYGYFFWLCHQPGVYRAYGREGQFVIVMPQLQAVIATMSMHHDVQSILDAVWKDIVPKL